jgi:hypothetical protein
LGGSSGSDHRDKKIQTAKRTTIKPNIMRGRNSLFILPCSSRNRNSEQKSFLKGYDDHRESKGFTMAARFGRSPWAGLEFFNVAVLVQCRNTAVRKQDES